MVVQELTQEDRMELAEKLSGEAESLRRDARAQYGSHASSKDKEDARRGRCLATAGKYERWARALRGEPWAPALDPAECLKQIGRIVGPVTFPERSDDE